MSILRKYISVIIIMCFGFAMIPSNGYSCTPDIAPVLHSCAEQATSVADDHQASCCHSDDSHEQSTKSSSSESCKMNACKCMHVTCSLFVYLIQEKQTLNSFFTLDKQVFGFKNSYLSLGYSSIWQPPK